MAAIQEAPTWDMSVVFASLTSEDFIREFEDLCRSTLSLVSHFSSLGVISTPSGDLTPANLAEAVRLYNNIQERWQPVGAFIYAFVSTDATNKDAQAKLTEMEEPIATLRKLYATLTACVGNIDVDAFIASDAYLSEHAYTLRKLKKASSHLMSPVEESLAADLFRTGSIAWGRLYDDLTSQLSVPVTIRGEDRKEPMPVIRNLAYDPDREVRKAAYHAELDCWKSNEIPIAACLNAIKGEFEFTRSKRGWAKAVSPAVFDCNMDQSVLDSMIGAATDAFPIFRRYLRAKAKLLFKEEKLAWYDLFAPAGESNRTWSFQEGAEFVAQQFDGYSKKMGDFARRNFEERWVDAAPANAKTGGAFCMGLRNDESRILMTWKPSFGSVSTLAHELGHAYHNLCLNGRTELQKDTPMTLAETASIFCETIIIQAAIEQASASEKLAILEQSLQRTTQTVVDITSRYLFETSVFEKRAQHALSPDEFCELMADAQEKTYGDGMSDIRHPYMWAAKGHYYGSQFSFYNFPYMFGDLFSLGLYAIYKQDPEGFKAKYDDLLSRTGMADAAELAQGFGIDLAGRGFWEGSLSTIEQDVIEFERLVADAQ